MRGPPPGPRRAHHRAGRAWPALGGYPHLVATVAVVGAGPKGIAIAAKARALAAAGLTAPRVVLVERGEVAGNWSGRQGYTSGLLPLGTPPEKDIGYPYAASWGDASGDVVAAMAPYSWQRHLIRHGAYSDWVDRGRMRPAHRQWSAYLREVAGAAEAEIISGVVSGLDVSSGGLATVFAGGTLYLLSGNVVAAANSGIATSLLSFRFVMPQRCRFDSPFVAEKQRRSAYPRTFTQGGVATSARLY